MAAAAVMSVEDDVVKVSDTVATVALQLLSSCHCSFCDTYSMVWIYHWH
jgi:hypothetical protein